MGVVVGAGIASCATVFAEASLKAYLFPSQVTYHVKAQSKLLDVSGDNQVINVNNKAYIPLRLFSESLGATVNYQAPSLASNGFNAIDITFQENVANSVQAWTLTQTNGYFDGILSDSAGISFGKTSIHFDTKTIKPLISFKNSAKQAITIEPLNIEYQVVKVNEDGTDTVLFDYKIPTLGGKVPASSLFTANVPAWDFKDSQGNFVEPGKYALVIKAPKTLDYTFEGSKETKTISKLSKYYRWEYDITQDIINSLVNG
jgi:hypothetical protein